MTPQRTSDGGQIRTDWQRKTIGRIRLAYGRTEREHARAVQLLDDLWHNDQHDVLRALKSGEISIRELLAAKKAGRSKRDDLLIDLKLRRPLWETLEAQIARRPGGAKHHTRLRTSLAKFARSPIAGKLGTKAVVADLENVDWRALRASFDSAADWNHLRKAIGATLSALLEDVYHPFRRAVMKRIPTETEMHHDVDVSVDQFWALVDALPEHVRPGIVTLAVTGMRLNTEYLRATEADKRPNLPGLYSPGSKNADAAGTIAIAPELWEWVDAGVPAPIKGRLLRVYFHRAACAVGLGQMVIDPRGRLQVRGRDTGKPLLVYDGITLHDLRHLALQLALDGGAQLNDVQAFARHADPAMTMRYLKRAGGRRAADAIGKQLARPAKVSNG